MPIAPKDTEYMRNLCLVFLFVSPGIVLVSQCICCGRGCCSRRGRRHPPKSRHTPPDMKEVSDVNANIYNSASFVPSMKNLYNHDLSERRSRRRCKEEKERQQAQHLGLTHWIVCAIPRYLCVAHWVATAGTG